jgi:5-methylcytosine-specific restriction endonuclease McrA
VVYTWDLYTEDDIALSIDHITPKAKGGTNHLENLQLMCLECNNLKMHVPERIEGYSKL